MQKRITEKNWRVQAEVFAGTALCVRDLPAPAQRTMLVAGYAPATRLEDVCRAHAATLAHLAPLGEDDVPVAPGRRPRRSFATRTSGAGD